MTQYSELVKNFGQSKIVFVSLFPVLSGEQGHYLRPIKLHPKVNTNLLVFALKFCY